jgi:hypothetical protein
MLVDFIPKYCAEWLTFQNPSQKKLGGVAPQIHGTNRLLGLKL